MEEKSVRRQVNHLVVDTGAFVKNYPIFVSKTIFWNEDWAIE